jgi:hypothetical protein
MRQVALHIYYLYFKSISCIFLYFIYVFIFIYYTIYVIRGNKYRNLALQFGGVSTLETIKYAHDSSGTQT